MLIDFPLWLPVWFLSTIGLALMAVFHYHRHHHWLHHHELIDHTMSNDSPMSAMQSRRALPKNAFRMGDFLLHTMPLTVRFWFQLRANEAKGIWTTTSATPM